MSSVSKKVISLGLREELVLVAWVKSASQCSDVGLDFLTVSGFSFRVFARRVLALDASLCNERPSSAKRWIGSKDAPHQRL